MLAKLCFAADEDYKEVFAIDPGASEVLRRDHRKSWTDKIKNRVTT
jgi:hypothetical protein